MENQRKQYKNIRKERIRCHLTCELCGAKFLHLLDMADFNHNFLCCKCYYTTVLHFTEEDVRICGKNCADWDNDELDRCRCSIELRACAECGKSTIGCAYCRDCA